MCRAKLPPPPPWHAQNKSGLLDLSISTRGAGGIDRSRGREVVAGQPRPARVVANPAAERQPGDTHVGTGADGEHPFPAAQCPQQFAADRPGLDHGLAVAAFTSMRRILRVTMSSPAVDDMPM